MSERRMLLIDKTSNTIPNNEIWYTSSDGNIVTPHDTSVFGATIISNTYIDGKGIIKFDGDVTSIGISAFMGCEILTSIVIPNSVTSIENYAFQSCSSLTSIIIHNNITSIKSYIFKWCTALTFITISNSVTSIGHYPFYSCIALTSITFEGTIEEWNAVEKDDYWWLNSPIKTIHCTDGDINL